MGRQGGEEVDGEEALDGLVELLVPAPVRRFVSRSAGGSSLYAAQGRGDLGEPEPVLGGGGGDGAGAPGAGRRQRGAIRVNVAAGRLARVAPGEADEGAAPRVLRLALRCRNLESCVGGCTWAVLAGLLDALRALREAAPVSESKLRRGDETALELCADPLYVNGAGVLAARDVAKTADDQEVVALGHLCRRGDAMEVLGAALDGRSRGGDVCACLATVVDRAGKG